MEITLRRSARARRYSLRVSRVDGRVTLTVPPRASAREALAFAQEHEGWIRAALAELPSGRRISADGTVPVAGVERLITAAPVKVPHVDGHRLLVPGRLLDGGRAAGPGVAACLRTLARARLTELCDGHAATVGAAYSALVLRDTRSRWGSCSSDGRLMFSWRLIMAPPEVLDYVAAHEVAHLAEMNHSPAFWATVARLMPAYREHRGWLRAHGAMLHRVDFSG
ncbi:MAG: M48 family metallopeptidase [Rhodobacteraceae bacterium]|nr:M48 family metallopeptidase [Paracoccaceae bacterium]